MKQRGLNDERRPFLGVFMPVESPEQFELESLEMCLHSLEFDERAKSVKFCLVFAVIGCLLFLAIYFLHGKELLSQSFLYLIAALGGLCLGGAAIINRLSMQSDLIKKYIDRDAINERIKQLKM